MPLYKFLLTFIYFVVDSILFEKHMQTHTNNEYECELVTAPINVFYLKKK